MNWAASHLATGSVVQNGRFSLEEGWSKGAISKRKESIILGQDTFSLGKEEDFYHIGCLFSLWGMGRAHVTDDLTKKIPYWLIKIVFLGEAETAVRSGISSRPVVFSSIGVEETVA